MQVNIMNKAVNAMSNKTGGTEADAVLREVASVTAQISNKDAEKCEKYAAEIEAAKAAQVEAEKEKENATTGKQFDAACDKGRRAEEKESFFSRKLDDLLFTPHLDDATYDECVAKVDAMMSKEANAYKAKVSEAMRIIVEATKDLQALAKDADRVLNDLDTASNVLQSRYRYVVARQVAPDDDPALLAMARVEDKYEWLRHRTRYVDAHRNKLYEMVHTEMKGVDSDFVDAAWRVAIRILKL